MSEQAKEKKTQEELSAKERQEEYPVSRVHDSEDDVERTDYFVRHYLRTRGLEDTLKNRQMLHSRIRLRRDLALGDEMSASLDRDLKIG